MCVFLPLFLCQVHARVWGGVLGPLLDDVAAAESDPDNMGVAGSKVAVDLAGQ